jgi:hypothetical protein
MDYGVAKAFHHLAELENLHRESTGSVHLVRLRVRQTDNVKTHFSLARIDLEFK